MSVGFGFSAGDFIAGIQLVRQVNSSLQSSAGSALEYRTLVNELFSLERAMLEVKALRIEDYEAAKLDALKYAATQCQATVDLFLAKIRKYQPSLNAQGSGSKVRDSIRKIQWALCTKPDLDAFRAEVIGHTGSINILLATIQLNRARVCQDRPEKRQESVLTILGTNFSAHMRALGNLGSEIITCEKQIQQLLQSTTEIVKSNIDIYEMVLRVRRFIVALPPQVERKQPVYFTDAFGKEAAFFLEWVYSPEVLQDWLERRFEAVGRDKIIRKEFAIEDIKTKREIDLSEPWHTLFYPGMHVGMEMVFIDLEWIYKNTCPTCQTETCGNSSEEVLCSHCGASVRRVTILDDSAADEIDASDEEIVQNKRTIIRKGKRPFYLRSDGEIKISGEMLQQKKLRQEELCQFRRVRLLSEKQLRLLKPKPRWGFRTGLLSEETRERARAIREIGACWPCRISKQKCNKMNLPCDKCQRREGWANAAKLGTKLLYTTPKLEPMFHLGGLVCGANETTLPRRDFLGLSDFDDGMLEWLSRPPK